MVSDGKRIISEQKSHPLRIFPFRTLCTWFCNSRAYNPEREYGIIPLNEGDTPDGCRINSAVENEFFLLESRTKTRWDEYLSGEGLLVHRVDLTNPAVWENNRVNATSGRTYYTHCFAPRPKCRVRL